MARIAEEGGDLMFFDYAKIHVKAGDGGNGLVSYRREKFVPDGGPWGGDGGNGASILLEADPGMRTLLDFKHKNHYKAERGGHGMTKGMHGRSAEDLVLRVPLGTVVRDAESGELLADITEAGMRVRVVKGGRGGRGNMRFATRNNTAPDYAENGEPGEERWLLLELKLISDVGLIGMPNAGKSTLLSRVTGARPKIADYPFTTLDPNLGVVDMGDGESFVLADVPGLIEGAHAGAGLGHRFLRHVERTRVLIHMLDMSEFSGREPWDDFYTINEELRLYQERLASRPQIVAANKMDAPGAAERLPELKKRLGDAYEIFPVSTLTGEGLKELIGRAYELLKEQPEQEEALPSEELRHVVVTDEPDFVFSREADGTVLVGGPKVEKLVAMTDFANEASCERLGRILTRMGLDEALRKWGVQDGDSIRIGKQEFDFVEANH